MRSSFAAMATYELCVVLVVLVSAGIAVKMDAISMWILDFF